MPSYQGQGSGGGGFEEKSLLDQALDNYSRMADKYYAKKNEVESATPDVRKKREAELTQIKRLLDHQRMSAESMASVQAGLDLYREGGRLATQGSRSEVAQKQKALLAEEHHPTEDLEKYMLAAIKPRPSKNHTAHHIVPGSGRAKQKGGAKSKYAYLARVHMHRFGIRINDPDNGVWLPTYKKHTPHWATPLAKGHLEYHTAGYEEWIQRKIRAKSDEVSIRFELNQIERLILANNLPPETRKKS